MGKNIIKFVKNIWPSLGLLALAIVMFFVSYVYFHYDDSVFYVKRKVATYFMSLNIDQFMVCSNVKPMTDDCLSKGVNAIQWGRYIDQLNDQFYNSCDCEDEDEDDNNDMKI